MTKILTKLHAIMADVSYIQKDKKNAHQGYTYASEAAIKDAIHEQLVKHGVIFAISTSNPRVENSVTWIDCAYRFLDVESGEELTGTFLGSGSARDEKGHYAAVTGAIKYILTSNLLIPTGDDPENDEPVKTPRPTAAASKPVPTATPKPPVRTSFSATSEQRESILKLTMERLGAKTAAEVVPALNAKFNLGLKSSADITRVVATTLIKSLEAIKVDTTPATAGSGMDVDE